MAALFASLYHPLMPPSVEWGPYPRPLLPQVGPTRPFFAGKLLRTSPMRQPCILHDIIFTCTVFVVFHTFIPVKINPKPYSN